MENPSCYDCAKRSCPNCIRIEKIELFYRIFPAIVGFNMALQLHKHMNFHGKGVE